MGNTPDVRIRLSAEGERAILDLFRKIQSEADRTGKIGSKGFGALTSEVSSLTRLLPALSFGAAIAGAVALAKESLETADSFAKLSQRTGVSVETLSGWSHAADLAGFDVETLGNALARLARNMQTAAQGGEEQLRAFQRVGITQKQLQDGTVTLDDALLKISAHVAQQPDDWRKSAEAQEFFGKTGDRLLPFLDQGPEGLKRMRQEAETLGKVFSTETALAAEQFNDNMRRLRGTVEGFANRELAALLPLLDRTAEALLQISTNADQAGDSLTRRFIQSVAILRAPISVMLENLGKAPLSIEDFSHQVETEIQALEKLLLGPLPTAKPPKGSRGGEPPIGDQGAQTRALNALKQFADARLALERGRLDNELALVKAHNAALEAEDKRLFKEGLTAINDFYDARRQAIESEGDQEIDILTRQAGEIGKRIADLAATPLAKKEDPKTRQAEITKLIQDRDKVESAIELKRVEIQGKLAANAADQRQAVRAGDVEQLRTEAELASAQGRRFDAERANLDAQIAGMQRLAGESDQSFEGRKQAIREAGEAQIAFAELQAQARAVLADIDSGRRAVQALIARNAMTELEGEKQIAEIEKERLPTLEGIAGQMGEIAASTKDPEQAASVRDLNDAVVDLATSADLTGRRIHEFLMSFEAGLTRDFFDFFTRGIAEAHSLGDAFRSLAASVVATIQQIVAQMLAAIVVAQIMKAVIGVASAGASSGASSGTITTNSAGEGGGSFLAGATGGLIDGPGTGTSDSIPIWVSAGEYLVREAAVRQPGNLEILEAMNSFRSYADLQPRSLGRVRGFAQGGLVEGKPGASGKMFAEFDLNEALVMKRLSLSPEFDRAILRVVGGNPKQMRRLLQI